MKKYGLLYLVIQIICLTIAFYFLAIAIAGSHGRLYFFGDGWKVVLIITIILSIPLIYVLRQGKKNQNRKTLNSISIFLFLLSMGILYIGIPIMTKQFIINEKNVDKILIFKDSTLTIEMKLEPEMFNRVSVELNINKASDVELKQLDLTITNNKNEIVKPVFQPLAWDSIHHETIQMNTFYEINEYTKMKKFALSAQYSIEQTDSLRLEIVYTFTRNGQIKTESKLLTVKISKYLTLEKLIEYKY
ncbi:MAG: hypothetical protein JWO92_2168 [Chitinophagaceae bacterium]|nr:hypothetical protein [Chitinophagaceae bacterium]